MMIKGWKYDIFLESETLSCRQLKNTTCDLMFDVTQSTSEWIAAYGTIISIVSKIKSRIFVKFEFSINQNQYNREEWD